MHTKFWWKIMSTMKTKKCCLDNIKKFAREVGCEGGK
jgi:hypothetical protein